MVAESWIDPEDWYLTNVVSNSILTSCCKGVKYAIIFPASSVISLGPKEGAINILTAVADW